MKRNYWWAYLHKNGTLQIKRYHNEIEVMDASNSPFVQLVISPVEARNRADAERKLREKMVVEHQSDRPGYL